MAASDAGRGCQSWRKSWCIRHACRSHLWTIWYLFQGMLEEAGQGQLLLLVSDCYSHDLLGKAKSPSNVYAFSQLQTEREGWKMACSWWVPPPGSRSCYLCLATFRQWESQVTAHETEKQAVSLQALWSVFGKSSPRAQPGLGLLLSQGNGCCGFGLHGLRAMCKQYGQRRQPRCCWSEYVFLKKKHFSENFNECIKQLMQGNISTKQCIILD